MFSSKNVHFFEKRVCLSGAFDLYNLTTSTFLVSSSNTLIFSYILELLCGSFFWLFLWHLRRGLWWIHDTNYSATLLLPPDLPFAIFIGVNWACKLKEIYKCVGLAFGFDMCFSNKSSFCVLAVQGFSNIRYNTANDYTYYQRLRVYLSFAINVLAILLDLGLGWFLWGALVKIKQYPTICIMSCESKCFLPRALFTPPSYSSSC